VKALLSKKEVTSITKVCSVLHRSQTLFHQTLFLNKICVFLYQVIPTSKLKTHYKSYESRRQLLAMYDIFLCDNRIYYRLPKLLGKEFYRKKK
jgi:ribosome biogenesis protein UTP30